MVTKITEVISKDPKISLRGLSINSSEGLFDGQITVLVSDTDHLAQLISRLKRIQGVSSRFGEGISLKEYLYLFYGWAICS